MPEAPPSLRELERLLFALIRGPDGLLATLNARGVSRRQLAALVEGDQRLGPLGRVGIYADMYRWRLLDVLRDMFPKLRAVLGDDDFAGLGTDYLTACPSRHPSLRHLGDRLAAFLMAPESARPHTPPVPDWASDLAALEWARHDVFDAADAGLWTMPALQALAPEAFSALPLRLAPGHRLLTVGHGVEDVWRRLHAEQPAGKAPRRPGTLLIWRQDTQVYHRRPEPLEAALLENMLDAGTTFGAVCEEIGGRVADPVPVAFGLLARWATDGLLMRDPAA